MSNSKKLILSIYDRSGIWPSYYISAGYPVRLWDLAYEGCIIENFSSLYTELDELIEEGYELYGLLAAVPCTDFASSGAQWWPEKDKYNPELEPWESQTEFSKALAFIVIELVERYKPKFWAIENPVGRIEKVVPDLQGKKRLTFNPCDYGDPYTKKTILWGEFNPDLPRNPVEPIEGSKMHKLGQSKKRAELRSQTPKGFARAFYLANQ